MSNKLLIAIVVSIVAAAISVLLFGEATAPLYVLGELFLGALQLVIVPLIMFSVISGLTAMGDVRRLGKLGGWTVAYYLGTMLVAACIGLIVVGLLAPGEGVALSGEPASGEPTSDLRTIVLGFVGNNIVASMAEMELVPVILFSLLFGVVASTLPERARAVIELVDAGNAVMMRIVGVLMYAAPVGIYGLIAGRFGTALAEGGREAFLDQLAAVGHYMVAVAIGLAIHSVVVLPLLLLIFARRNPLRYVRQMGGALLTALSTSSSSATLPVTLDAATGEAGVDDRAARFVLPLGATVNMDGSALYEAMAAMFIAQAAGIDLSVGQQVVIVFVATLAAMGAAGVPEAGLVTMVIVLRAADLPLSGLELLLPIDWMLDRLRTAVNVWGDSVGAASLESLVADG